MGLLVLCAHRHEKRRCEPSHSGNAAEQGADGMVAEAHDLACPQDQGDLAEYTDSTS